MNDPQGNYKMRFICGPNGKLLKGAPGNFKCGEVVSLPFRHSRFAFWELIDTPPTLKVPDMSEAESVYEETTFLPVDDDEDEVAEIVMSFSAPIDEDLNLSPDTSATIEPYMRYNTGTGVFSEIPEEQEEEKELTRDELLTVLADAGVEVKRGTRTTTLQRMVDELVSKE